ncbi:MAG: hypothetical protein IJ730_06180 [Alphaproteobacteria bacterium]|nr:hypothetical protein [Alphaproteobacteria bacterium]
MLSRDSFTDIQASDMVSDKKKRNIEAVGWASNGYTEQKVYDLVKSEKFTEC